MLRASRKREQLRDLAVALPREAGAARAINFYRQEISRTMAYLGCRSVAELNRDFLDFVGTPHTPAAM